MKDIFITAIVLLIVMLSLPLVALKKPLSSEALNVNAAAPDESIIKSDSNDYTIHKNFRIKLSDSDTVKKIDAKDYVFGVVAAEMPALYEEEALKAQAVAAYTFACRRADNSKDRDFDLTDDPETDQCYIDRDKARERWGDNADKYTQKLESIIDATAFELLTYKGSAALTVYHAISSGVTESCENVWGTALPYLISVESVGDKLAEQYITEVKLTKDELKDKLKGLCDISDDDKAEIKKTTDTGRVVTVNIGKKEISGAQLAKALSLRSANFEIEYKDNNIIFTVKGYGHGVGMSQNGANFMAKQGADYKEILNHYYPGCTLFKGE